MSILIFDSFVIYKGESLLGRIAEIAESAQHKEFQVQFVVLEEFTIGDKLHFEYDMPTVSRASGARTLIVPPQVRLYFNLFQNIHRNVT